MKKKTVKTKNSKEVKDLKNRLKDCQRSYNALLALHEEKYAALSNTINNLRNENGALLNIIDKLQSDLEIGLEAHASLELHVKEQQDSLYRSVEIANQNLEISKSAVKNMLSKDNDLQLAVFNYDSLHQEYLKSKIKCDTLLKENEVLKNKKRFLGIF